MADIHNKYYTNDLNALVDEKYHADDHLAAFLMTDGDKYWWCNDSAEHWYSRELSGNFSSIEHAEAAMVEYLKQVWVLSTVLV